MFICMYRSFVTGLVLGFVPTLLAQNAKVGSKVDAAQAEASETSEIDHMMHLVAKLKLEIPKIQDPNAKQAAIDNLDLWQHLLDHLMQENQSANNTGKEHHHADDPAAADLKQSPKPQ